MLHITNGDSVAVPLRQTALEGEAFAWRDVYHEGPVRSGERSRLIDARAAFLSSCGWGEADAIRDELLARDARFVDALRDGSEIVLWFEHDLYDQLQLIDLLALAGETGFDPEQLELIEIGSFPGRPGFRGLGELNVAELESLWPGRRTVTDEDTAGAQLAWEAVRRADPRGLAEVRLDPPPSRPFLAGAFGRLLEELPRVNDGLSRTERQLLLLLADGPLLTGALFVASQDLEEAPFHGDAWVLRTLEGLEGSTSLVSLTGGSAAITDAGRSVLAGEADRVALLGIDRWVGGTHLVPDAVWRWDAEASELVAPA
ncbi:MAG TPA: DUF1835 domain-containing protein [Gaiellaceae bacterium]|nr:DUF1835 domain-containing protein [Gaiellaceae bacterium]